MARKKLKKTVTFSLENDVIEYEENEPIIDTNQQMEPISKDIENTDDVSKLSNHVIIQLPISANNIETILSQDDMCNALEYNPKMTEPIPYIPVNSFSSKNDEIINQCDLHCEKSKDEKDGNTCDSTIKNAKECNNTICFWCCHPIEHNQFGMPIRYDSVHKSFTYFGTFCSLECVSAYNFSIHMGSDRAWDVQSWIQIIARSYGIIDPIRPAPSRYSLRMFDGTLTIEEFRKVHKTFAKSIIVNIPPLVSIKTQIETLNTSFFSIETAKEASMDINKKVLKRKTPTNESKKTLESKLYLSYSSLSDILETTPLKTIS